ncbi:MAG: hypothetical protein K2L81_00470, partial [Muribaculaceae bacterium]|nr:hypothetical protein [Muribaculaceae bacterium]
MQKYDYNIKYLISLHDKAKYLYKIPNIITINLKTNPQMKKQIITVMALCLSTLGMMAQPK